MAYVLIRETKRSRRAPLVVCISAAAGLGLSGALLGGTAYGEALAVGLTQFIPFLAPVLLPDHSNHVIRVKADSRGHYVVKGTADGVSLEFLIDSGATNIVLTKADARRLNAGPLRFNVTTSTANGPVKNAEITIGTLTVGSQTLTRVPALVNGGELEESLLGMAWLRQFQSIEIKNGVMTLYF